MSASSDLEALCKAGALGRLDVWFASALSRLGGSSDRLVELGAALASRAVTVGDVCVDLRACAGRPVDTAELDDPKHVQGMRWPELDAWRAALQGSPAVGVRREGCPLVLDDDRLYLARMWLHERRVAEALRDRAKATVRVEGMDVEAQLDALFASVTEADSRQRDAVRQTLTRPLVVITGGPGTGKTTIVARIVALLAAWANQKVGRLPLIALLAPTGKAAVRLREAVESELGKLPLQQSFRGALVRAIEAMTIHRALGQGRGGERAVQHHRDDPLPSEVVIVDEASMVDLVLMSRLLDALRPGARLVLLGDEHQLASVEAGSVLGDICAASDALDGCVVRLARSWRYPAEGAIGRLADAIRAGDVDRVLEVLERPGSDEVVLRAPVGSSLPDELVGELQAQYRDLSSGDVPRRLAALQRFRVLCAHRRGPASVALVNESFVERLRSQGRARHETLFDGRPVLVTRNEHDLDLYNGDIGVLAPGENDELVAWFPTASGPRAIPPQMLPPHETVFAMSVHKAQGSEADAVAVLLPMEPSPIVTRELLYTAVTRARRRVVVYASRDVVAAAVRRRVARSSGLRERLTAA
ncbi:MAG: exodeoxyribonuclease V subunit alpha [Myxococcota bacterium]|nr:exodeoxyribonuclease V subunit alpha [Myxococcota bacterium]MDW8363421.1 exodeoxyribonuclease V subunit alpha [Myxococcales bacterium]